MKDRHGPLMEMDEEINRAYGAAPIAARFEDCLQCFEQLHSILETDQDAENLSSPPIEGALSKFRQWGIETGAPSRALDHALRHASELRQTTEDLLADLLSALQSMLDRNVSVSQTIFASNEFNIEVERTVSGNSQPSRASSESDSSLQQLSDDVEECVSCLVKLRPVFDDPVPQDIFEQSSSSNTPNDDIEFATRMFPKAKKALLRRLAFVDRRRRQILLKLKLEDKTVVSPESYSHQSNQNRLDLSGFHYTNIRSSMAWATALSSHVAVSSPGSSYTGGGSTDDGVFSKQDYFSSRAATSISGSEHVTEVKHYEIPKAPVTLNAGSVFNCSYCGQEIIFGLQINSNEDWNEHVLLDLEPYICGFEDCIRGQRTFRSREDWWQHELSHHRLTKTWHCQSCNHSFDNAGDMERHLEGKHKISDDHEQLALMISLCEKYSENDTEDKSCYFCGSTPGSVKELKEHIADHMEQFALSAIEAVYGPVKQWYNREEGSSDEKTKMEFLKKFVHEQRGLYWNAPNEAQENGSGGSNVAFLEDSDDEVGVQKVSVPAIDQSTHRTPQRPGMGRRGNSWMKKVNTFLEIRPNDQEGNEQSSPMLSSSSQNQYIPELALRRDQETPSDLAGRLSRSPTDPKVVLPTLPRCLRTRPPSRNNDFIGREPDFARLHDALSEAGAIVVVSGAGGIGKTDMAIEYAYRYEEAYSYIFWVSAETLIRCADTYSIIATEFVVSDDNVTYGQERLISLGREFLEQIDARWLLVFDNACSWSNLQRFMPTNLYQTAGSILITARASDITDIPGDSNCRFLELKPLSLDESRLFLLKSMQRDLKVEEVQKHPEYSLAGAIAKESEGLPLALSHIAGYIQVSACTLTDFVQLWNERRRHKTLSVPPTNSSLTSTNKTLETVWNIGLREVTIDARDLLNILAFLDCDHIQRKLLVGDHKEPSLEFLHSDQTFRYKRMISELTRRNIIAVHAQDGETLVIHRAFQLKILQDLDEKPQKRDEVFSQAFALIRKKFPLPSPIQVPEPAKWPACKEYLPHVLHLENVATRLLPSITLSVDLARLLSDGGIDLWERGMTSEGLRLLKSAETILDRLGVEESHLRANIHVIINLLIQDCDLTHLEESRHRIRQALKIRLNHQVQCRTGRYPRTDGILLHNAWSDYGCVLLQYNRYEKAEPMFQKCLVKYLEWGSEAEIPYEYYKYNHHVAFCRMYQHDFARAIEMAEKSLELIKLATGESSATSKTVFDLACILLQSGDISRALALHREVLESNLRLHGKFNFLTLQSYYAVGVVSEYANDLTEAEHLLSTALDLERQWIGTCSRAANARTQFRLAQILKKQGKDAERAEYLESLARTVLAELLPANPLDVGVVDPEDEIALFDHLQPVFDGRFAGRSLLKYVSKKK